MIFEAHEDDMYMGWSYRILPKRYIELLFPWQVAETRH
jgi:hypothetical protein